jgi:hypothetical protein
MPRPRVVYLLAALLVVSFAACGGGGGGGDDGGSSTARTTFTGNLTEAAAVTPAQIVDVEVCVENTTFCTFVDANGFFTLAADVGGVVVLVFTGPDFVARVTLTDVPLGATVRLTNIRCSTITGTCEPEDIEIEGSETRGPIRCQQGPLEIVHVGELVIDGHGEDCIRTEGQCEVTIDADRIVLLNCETCVRTAGGSDVTLITGPGGFQRRRDQGGGQLGRARRRRAGRRRRHRGGRRRAPEPGHRAHRDRRRRLSHRGR